MSRIIYKHFASLVDLSLTATKTREHDCNFKIEINGKKYKCYSASVSNREISLNCEGAFASYVVDSYGDRHLAELFNYELEDEE
jgi:hypothetical protein